MNDPFRTALLSLPALLSACALPVAQEPDTRPTASLEDVFARVQSSVVTIRTASHSVVPDEDGTGQLTAIAGLGSGVVIDRDGSVLTAAHVVHTADIVHVVFPDGTEIPADVIASDLLNDVALIRVRDPFPASTHIATLGDSDRVRVGRDVFVVGAPRGISHTLTVGHISARRSQAGPVRSVFDTELFQTDAAINQGNSGGPMFDMKGEVIGIVSHIVSTTGGNEGLGFAVTSNVVRRILIEGDAFWSGVEVVVLTGELARVLNLPEGRSGMLVQRVARHSPAAALGLRDGVVPATIAGQPVLLGGDVILAVQGIEVGQRGGTEKVRHALRGLENGQDLVLQVLRGGEVEELRSRVER